ncbi:MAG: ComEC/Rec2 family competence protein [Phycisphaerae bacterium]
MTSTGTKHPWIFLRHHPLVPAAALLLLGIAICNGIACPAVAAAAAALVALVAWAVAECMLEGNVRTWAAHVSLAIAILFAGVLLWQINQRQVQPTHIARFAPLNGELPVTIRGRVVAAPAAGAGRDGNTYFTMEATSLLTGQGWISACGLAQVKWRANVTAPEIREGDGFEAYGWLSRPRSALNPGGVDMRRKLAADRIFAQVRVPRSFGIVLAERGSTVRSDWLADVRMSLRGKLLQHTVNVDADAANTMVALLLGQRDPSIDNVSRAFADAGVAHLLAISGAHIVFLAGVVWLVLRFIPMRPQWREVVCATIVVAYVLATPCGPPVVRAAIVVVMVLMSRLMRRPPTYLNLLAAAAICIVFIRPADLLDAGFQLTFVCTAALLLMGERVHSALFARALHRAAFIADLADTGWARFKLKVRKVICGAMTANLIGTVASVPLVLFHFQQVTLYGVVTGLIAFPIVAFVMMLSLVQLVLELVWAAGGEAFATISVFFAHWMVSIVRHLSEIPGAVIPMRAPPVGVVVLLYVPLVLWVLRRRIRLPRAVIVNVVAASLMLAGGAYAADSPSGVLRLQVLSVGQGSAVVIAGPEGDALLVNAGSRDLPDIVPTAIAPALRTDGVRHFGTMLVTGMDSVHAKNAAEVVERYRVKRVLVPPDDGTTTFARMSIDDAVKKAGSREEEVKAGDWLLLGSGARLRVLWPASGKSPGANSIVMVEYAQRRVLMLDPGNLPGLALLLNGGADLQCDAVILLGPDRGRGDAALLDELRATGAGTVVFSGKSPWSSIASSPGALNAADGAVTVTVGGRGSLTVER